MYKKVLVPYDLSEPAHHAFSAALDLVKGVDGSTVTVLYVEDWHDYNAETFKIASRMSGVLGDSLDMDAIAGVSEEAAAQATEKVSADIAKVMDERGSLLEETNLFEIAVINGSPHDSITAYADENDYDCIVMGHRGLGAVRGMLGSVCYSVLHKTNKPVLIVK